MEQRIKTMDDKVFEGMGLSDEAKARVREATSAEELLAIAREEGVELSVEQLEGVSGGWGTVGCKKHLEGDVRTDVDESLVSEAFRTGAYLGYDD